jgi:hypothetical protein
MATLIATLVVATLGILLLSPRARAHLERIALRRFYDRHLRQPRYRFYDPRDPDRDES